MLDLNFSPFPELETERLLLRRITENYAADLFEMRSDKRVMQFIDRPLAITVDDTLKLIKVMDDALNKNDGISWGIILKENNKLIGTIGYWRIEKEHHRAEIGYALNADYHYKGIMQEAFSVVLPFGFQKMNLHSIEGNVNPLNVASIKILERNQFVREAYFRENYLHNGKFLDSAIYSLLAPE